MQMMFYNNSHFDQDISLWNVNPSVNLGESADGLDSGMDSMPLGTFHNAIGFSDCNQRRIYDSWILQRDQLPASFEHLECPTTTTPAATTTTTPAATTTTTPAATTTTPATTTTTTTANDDDDDDDDLSESAKSDDNANHIPEILLALFVIFVFVVVSGMYIVRELRRKKRSFMPHNQDLSVLSHSHPPAREPMHRL